MTTEHINMILCSVGMTLPPCVKGERTTVVRIYWMTYRYPNLEHCRGGDWLPMQGSSTIRKKGTSLLRRTSPVWGFVAPVWKTRRVAALPAEMFSDPHGEGNSFSGQKHFFIFSSTSCWCVPLAGLYSAYFGLDSPLSLTITVLHNVRYVDWFSIVIVEGTTGAWVGLLWSALCNNDRFE